MPVAILSMLAGFLGSAGARALLAKLAGRGIGGAVLGKAASSMVGQEVAGGLGFTTGALSADQLMSGNEPSAASELDQKWAQFDEEKLQRFYQESELRQALEQMSVDPEELMSMMQPRRFA